MLLEAFQAIKSLTGRSIAEYRTGASRIDCAGSIRSQVPVLPWRRGRVIGSESDAELIPVKAHVRVCEKTC